MKLDPKVTTVGASPVWLDTTEGLRFLTDGVTIDSTTVAEDDGRRVIRSGTPIGRVGAKWGPTADAGTGDAEAILWETLDVTDGDAHGGAIDHGRVRTPALPVELAAGDRTALQGRGITFRD
jgi:hypothetical protein